MKYHPWLSKYPIKKKVEHLIIGTHPPMPYCGKLPFFYGNMNEFWRFLDKVYPNNNLYDSNGCPCLKDIKAFLEKAKMAITDMVEETNGQPFSTDDDMVWTKLNSKLKEQLKTSKVKKIYFTSSAGKNSALSLFKKWLKENKKEFDNIKIPAYKDWRSEGHKIELYGKEIKLVQLFSPSPTARRSMNRIKEYKEWLKSNPNGSFDEFRIDWYRQRLPQI